MSIIALYSQWSITDPTYSIATTTKEATRETTTVSPSNVDAIIV